MQQQPRDARNAVSEWAAADAYLFEEDDVRDIDDPATTFGELLSCLRLAAHLSQNALGKAAGVNASYVNRLERGERTTPTREVVLALAGALDATPTERDRLLWLAGHVPVRLQQLGVSNRAMEALVDVLSNAALPPELRRAFCQCVEAMAAECDRFATTCSVTNATDPDASHQCLAAGSTDHPVLTADASPPARAGLVLP